MIFSENYANCVRTSEFRNKQKVPFLTLNPSATEARNAYTLLRFVMIIAQVNLFCAVTLDWEISFFFYMSSAEFTLQQSCNSATHLLRSRVSREDQGGRVTHSIWVKQIREGVTKHLLFGYRRKIREGVSRAVFCRSLRVLRCLKKNAYFFATKCAFFVFP